MKIFAFFILLVFVAVTLFNCLFYVENNLPARQLTCLLAIPVLLLYVISHTYHTIHFTSKLLIIAALASSWLGDFFLSAVQQPAYFQFGLIAFLLMHAFYTAFFLRLNVLLFHKKTMTRNLVYALFLLFFSSIYLYILFQKKILLPWVVVPYVLSMPVLLITAWNSFYFKNIRHLSTGFFIPGSIILTISGTSFLFGYFHHQQTGRGDLVVWVTYAIAQLLLVAGAVRFIKKKQRHHRISPEPAVT